MKNTLASLTLWPLTLWLGACVPPADDTDIRVDTDSDVDDADPGAASGFSLKL